MSLQASTLSLVSVHISPVGAADVELEVSNGQVTGGGKIHRASASTHSSRALKTDIAYFGEDAPARALAEVFALKHATFRYKSPVARQPLTRGLIYEDTPDSIRGEGQTVVVDYRLMNLELALKAVNGRVGELEARIAALEAKKRGK